MEKEYALIYFYIMYSRVLITFIQQESLNIQGEFLDMAAQMKDSSMDFNYILNSKTMTFHKPECEKASRIGTKNKIYSYAEREELIGAGYTAAECCNP